MRESSKVDIQKRPTVSIILPTYNRARFLPRAIQSIRAQQFTDWELIIVDDGSTDDTAHLIGELTSAIVQPVHYFFQENQGAYGARNTGLDRAAGKYIAFFDSDDIWLPHHIRDCVEALEANPGVDRVWAACTIIDEATGKVLAPTTFEKLDGTPKQFRKLRTRRVGKLNVIEDPDALRCMILHRMHCGLQNSLIRASLFNDFRFETWRRNEAEDQLFLMWLLAHRHRIGYFDDVHVRYYVHDANSSASGSDRCMDKRARIFREMIAGYERMAGTVTLSRAEKRALHCRLSREYFWSLGYSIYLQGENYGEALSMFRKGLAYWPWSLRCWKTYMVWSIRHALRTAISKPAIASTTE